MTGAALLETSRPAEPLVHSFHRQSDGLHSFFARDLTRPAGRAEGGPAGRVEGQEVRRGERLAGGGEGGAFSRERR